MLYVKQASYCYLINANNILQMDTGTGKTQVYVAYLSAFCKMAISHNLHREIGVVGFDNMHNMGF